MGDAHLIGLVRENQGVEGVQRAKKTDDPSVAQQLSNPHKKRRLPSKNQIFW